MATPIWCPVDLYYYIRPTLAANNVRVAHASGNTLRKNLTRTKPTSIVSDVVGAGCYVVRCRYCPLKYVGQTGRCFSVRLREHKDCVRLGRQNNAVFNHVSGTGHPIDWDNSNVFYHSNNIYNRIVVESTVIQEIPNFNNMPGVTSVDKLSRDLILKANSKIRDAIT